MIFTYFQFINICSPYKFVDILMTEILKMVKKCKIFLNWESQESLGAEHLIKNFPRWLGVAKF